MDHDQFFFGAFHGYDLDGPAFGVVTKADEPAVEYLRVSCGSGLLEAEAAVSDDMTDALLGYAMLGRRARDRTLLWDTLALLSDISVSKQALLWLCRCR